MAVSIASAFGTCPIQTDVANRLHTSESCESSCLDHRRTMDLLVTVTLVKLFRTGVSHTGQMASFATPGL